MKHTKYTFFFFFKQPYQLDALNLSFSKRLSLSLSVTALTPALGCSQFHNPVDFDTCFSPEGPTYSVSLSPVGLKALISQQCAALLIRLSAPYLAQLLLVYWRRPRGSSAV